MARCDVCGNESERTMAIEARGRQHTVDCFARGRSVSPHDCALEGVTHAGRKHVRGVGCISVSLQHLILRC
jgi:YD repeat-containing protein